MSVAYSEMPDPFLRAIVKQVDKLPGLAGICAGFEEETWRSEHLADHLLEWLPEFALNDREYTSLRGANAVRRLKEAARTVYSSDKYERRGELGEILLHAIIRQEFGSVPIISKVYFKDANNDTVKGFDAVHLVEAPDGLELWLGEVKFYTGAKQAIRDVVAELQVHTRTPYLRSEFAAIWRKVDPHSPYRNQLKPLLDGRNLSMDTIFKRLRIPVLLTYDSQTLSRHVRWTADYERAITAEFEKHHREFCQAGLPREIDIVLILLPTNTKKHLQAHFDRKLKGFAA
jgi:hypothetical protein